MVFVVIKGYVISGVIKIFDTVEKKTKIINLIFVKELSKPEKKGEYSILLLQLFVSLVCFLLP
jgi:hypothetical protein